MDFYDELKEIVRGEVARDAETLNAYSRDASLFEVRPRVVIFPKDVKDLSTLIKFVSKRKKDYPTLSLTARSGGTDMTGGPLNESIILDFSRHLNQIREVKLSLGSIDQGQAVIEPGVFYRDFEKATLKYNLLLPSFPASREICALGGMVANNAGGEKTLSYGKTDKYVKKIKAVLSDGHEYEFESLDRAELEEKMKLESFEGLIYRRMHKLLEDNYDIIQKARPKVSKNSAGYALWNVWDKKSFDLTKLFVGSQGTLGLITEITFSLVKPKRHSKMLIVFLKDFQPLVETIHRVLKHNPETFESYDDHTLKLAIKFLPQFIKLVKGNLFSIGWSFRPEILMFLTGGLPKLVLTAEFTGDNEEEIEKRVAEAAASLRDLPVKIRITGTAEEIGKYHLIRRESFNLLRHRLRGMQTAPFIDDIIVPLDTLPEFLPKLEEILKRYDLIYTIAGHVGDGNFHIIPLMNLALQQSREIIPRLANEVYELVFQFGGSMTAEHNDGLIRSPYLRAMYGDQVYKLFEEVKQIFDPDNIFNPGKKVDASLEYALAHLKHSG